MFFNFNYSLTIIENTYLSNTKNISEELSGLHHNDLVKILHDNKTLQQRNNIINCHINLKIRSIKTSAHS